VIGRVHLGAADLERRRRPGLARLVLAEPDLREQGGLSHTKSVWTTISEGMPSRSRFGDSGSRFGSASGPWLCRRHGLTL
jgi:hypothetical protein